MLTLPDLSQMSGSELRKLVRDRLHGSLAGGPMPDPQRDVRPYEWLLSIYNEAPQGLQQRLSHVFGGLLDESRGWPDRPQIELLDLLQQAGDEQVTDALQALLRRQPDQLDHNAARGAARLLKVLLARGHKGTPEFWLVWLDRLGSDYGALILSGLMEHGPNQVARHFSRLVESPKALRAVLRFLPNLEDRWGRDEVVQVLRAAMPGLPEETAALFGERYRELQPMESPDDCPVPSEHPELAQYWEALWTRTSSTTTCVYRWRLSEQTETGGDLAAMVVPPNKNRPPDSLVA